MKYLKISAILLAAILSSCCQYSKSKPQIAPQAKSLNISHTVLFGSDSAKLSKESEAEINNTIVSAVKNADKNAKHSITIESNCDQNGSAEYNKILGQKRAEAVQAFIAKQVGDSVSFEIVNNGKAKAENANSGKKLPAKFYRSVLVSVK